MADALGQKLERALRAELDDALELLRARSHAPSTRVHETRKHLKRARALLRLGAHGKRAKRLQYRLGLVARSLGAVRDPVAQLATWPQGEDYFEAADGEKIRAQLAGRRDRLATAPREERRLARAERVIADVRAQLHTLALGTVAGKSVQRAARLAYRNARLALRLARTEPTAQHVHELRRAAKRHQYQLQFFESLASRKLKDKRKRLHELTELLGLHHDAAGIQALVGADVAGAREGFERWQAELLTAIWQLSKQVLGERARDFARDLSTALSSRETHSRAA